MQEIRNKLWKYCTLIVLLLSIVLLEWLKAFPLVIERYYSNGAYPYIARFFRFCLGWLPFSLGDILYALALFFLLFKIFRFAGQWRKKKLDRKRVGAAFRHLLGWLATGYLAFNLLWGLNYHRAGSAYQLGLEPEKYSQQELQRLADTLQARLETVIPAIQPADSAVWLQYGLLTNACIEAYLDAGAGYPFLQYTTPSVKKMLVGGFGGYMGVGGYLNPFTGEAQVDAGMPPYARAFVMCHEMAHQLGYAAEEEANMVGYLAGRQSCNPAIRYSVYEDMFSYAIRELYRADSNAYLAFKEKLPPLFRQHHQQSRDYYSRFRNPFQPIINWWYDKYLKANSQEKGLQSYSYVTAWLIAYARKYGWEKL